MLLSKEIYNREGYDHEGYDRAGYNRAGYDKNGYDKNGYDRVGYDRAGHDEDGLNKNGFNRYGKVPFEVIQNHPIFVDFLKKVDLNFLKMSKWHSECGTAHCVAGWIEVFNTPKIPKLPEESTRDYAERILGVKSINDWFISTNLALRILTKLKQFYSPFSTK